MNGIFTYGTWLLHSGGDGAISQWTNQAKSDPFNLVTITIVVHFNYTTDLISESLP